MCRSPKSEIAISFDDRRRMEDRIYRLRTGYAWSQAPKSRTVRMVSNVEVFAAGAARMVRSNLLISEFRPDGTRFLVNRLGTVGGFGPDRLARALGRDPRRPLAQLVPVRVAQGLRDLRVRYDRVRGRLAGRGRRGLRLRLGQR